MSRRAGAPTRRHDRRLAVPQLITAGRLVLGATALVLALESSNLALAATLITLNVVIGGLNEHIAGWLESASPFGALFDSFADYLAIVVAPWALTRALLVSQRSVLQEVLLDLPLVTGALRYARNGVLVSTEGEPVQDPWGLSAVVCAFVGITAVFLRLPDLLPGAQLAVLLIPAIAALSLLMVVPLHYPKLTAVPGLSLAVLVLVAAMPFVQTERLAIAAIVLGLLYSVLGPLFAGNVTG